MAGNNTDTPMAGTDDTNDRQAPQAGRKRLRSRDVSPNTRSPGGSKRPRMQADSNVPDPSIGLAASPSADTGAAQGSQSQLVEGVSTPVFLDLDEWNTAWDNFINIIRAHDWSRRHQFRNLRRRMEDMRCYLAPPTSTWTPQPPSNQASSIAAFHEYRNHAVRNSWALYVARNRKDAQEEMDRALSALDGNGVVQWPSAPSSSPARQHSDEQHLDEQQLGNAVDLTPEDYEFDNDAIPGTWRYAKEIGSGAYGAAMLFVQCDDHKRITDRRVVKRSKKQENFNKPFYRTEGVDGDDWIPREYTLQSWFHNAKHIVQVEGYRVYKLSKIWRIYMEYCEHSNLQEVFDTAYRAKYDWIPTEFIWYCFEALVGALCHLRYGKAPDESDSPDSLQDGDPVVFHRDIKPENVFLAAPNADEWIGYPVPKLGDFGLAIEANAATADPHAGHCGTRPFIAPESAMSDGSSQRDAAADLYSVGYSIISIMNKGNDTSEEKQLYRAADGVAYTTDSDGEEVYGNDQAYSVSAQARWHYGDDLADLAESCVTVNPTSRPSAISMYRSILRRTGRRDEANKSMRERSHVGFKTEKTRYRLNMAMPGPGSVSP